MTTLESLTVSDDSNEADLHVHSVKGLISIMILTKFLNDQLDRWQTLYKSRPGEYMVSQEQSILEHSLTKALSTLKGSCTRVSNTSRPYIKTMVDNQEVEANYMTLHKEGKEVMTSRGGAPGGLPQPNDYPMIGDDMMGGYPGDMEPAPITQTAMMPPPQSTLMPPKSSTRKQSAPIKIPPGNSSHNAPYDPEDVAHVVQQMCTGTMDDVRPPPPTGEPRRDLVQEAMNKAKLSMSIPPYSAAALEEYQKIVDTMQEKGQEYMPKEQIDSADQWLEKQVEKQIEQERQKQSLDQITPIIQEVIAKRFKQTHDNE